MKKTGEGRNSQRKLIWLGILLMLGFAVLGTGCGKKAPVETDVTEPELPPPPPPVREIVPEPEDIGSTVPQVNYGLMDPSEYGIEDVFFDFDVYDLSAAAMSTLSASSRIMRDHPDLTWLIEGHCDERGTVEYNLALGEKRAISVREYLISLGVPGRQLRITSYGEEKPFSFGHNEDAWAKNRRGHFARP